MRSIDETNFAGKKILIRVDYNVPLNEAKEVTDDKRIRSSIPTIRKITKDGGAVILMAHLGRPEGEFKDKYSLKHIVPVLQKQLNQQVLFASDCVGEEAKEKASNLKSGEVLLLENLRFHKEEKEANEGFAQQLASLGDVYVNDAFGAIHRAHASMAVVPSFFEEKYAGKLLLKEIHEIKKVIENPQKPFTVIIGGAKVSDKIEVIDSLLEIVDNLLVAGALAYTFIKAKGGHIGDTKVESELLNKAKDLLQKAFNKKVKIVLPEDSLVTDSDETMDTKQVKSDQIPDKKKGMDIGHEARRAFSQVIKNSRTIFWNGPVGVFEESGFANGTKAIAQAIAEATQNGAYSLVGGGETTAALKKFGVTDQISHVSTGGGDLLKYIEGKKLPVIKALEETSHHAKY